MHHMVLHLHYDGECLIRPSKGTLEAELRMTIGKEEEADGCHTYPMHSNLSDDHPFHVESA